MVRISQVILQLIVCGLDADRLTHSSFKQNFCILQATFWRPGLSQDAEISRSKFQALRWVFKERGLCPGQGLLSWQLPSHTT